VLTAGKNATIMKCIFFLMQQINWYY